MKLRILWGRVIWGTILVILVVFSLAPIAWMLSTSFKPEAQIGTTEIRWIPKTFTLENYMRVFDQFEILGWLGNSVVVALAATVLVLILDSLAGYALARMEFAGRNLIFILIVSMLFVPIQITVVPLFLLFSQIDLIDTYPALILPIGANVTGVFIMRQFFMSIPSELEEAAYVDGAGTLRIWWSVVMPLARSSLTAVAIVTFLSAWNSFFWPLIATRTDVVRTLPVGIAQFMSTRPGQSMNAQAYGMSMAGAAIAAAPPILFFYVLQRQFIRGITMTGIKG
jgi:ABC-type glycerol-3-phosphate transport system permease component